MPPPRRWTVAAFAAICCLAAEPGLKAEEHVIRLGGVRKATATIIDMPEARRVDIRFLPVSAFDPATNKRLNQSKATGYAVRALARQLLEGAPKGQSLRVSLRGVEIVRTDHDGGFFHCSVQIPRSAIRITSPEQAKRAGGEHDDAPPGARTRDESQSRDQPDVEASAEIVDGGPQLLTRKSDYLDTLRRLIETLVDDAGLAARRAEDEMSLLLAIVDLEERAEQHFEALDRNVANDKMLLTSEAEEVCRHCRQSFAEFRSRLKRIVDEHAAQAERAKP